MLRTHCQTSGVSLTEQDPYNNIVRTAVRGDGRGARRHAEPAHQHASTRRSRCRPSSRPRIARNTQLILAEETGITHVVDPLGGCYYVEALTHEPRRRGVGAHRGGRGARRHDQGRRVGHAQAAHRGGRGRAARRASTAARTSIVGVNKYRLDRRAAVDVRDIDNTEVREQQIARLERVAGRRATEPACSAALDALAEGAAGDGNLLELAIEATRARATSARSPTRWRRCSAATAPRSVRSPACTAAPTRATRSFARIRKRGRRVRASDEGRRPRMLVAKIGQDGHDRGAKVIATAFADLGFDVDVGPLFQTPDEAARDAVENDVHVVGVSSQAAGHKTLVPAAHRRSCGRRARGDVVVVVGGVIPPQDYDVPRARPASRAVFGPGTQHPRRPRREVLGAGPRRAPHAGVTRRRLSDRAAVARSPTAVRAGDRRALARAITLVESTRADHRADGRGAARRGAAAHRRARSASASAARPARASRRSSRRSALHLVDAGHRVAVLAVDPSSARTGGSILGDKTRMEELVAPTRRVHPAVARRAARSAASPAARARRCSLCEAAGFDVVLVETVGVGQSEVAVAGMVDLFVLLLAPGRRRRAAGHQARDHRARRPRRRQQGRRRPAAAAAPHRGRLRARAAPRAPDGRRRGRPRAARARRSPATGIDERVGRDRRVRAAAATVGRARRRGAPTRPGVDVVEVTDTLLDELRGDDRCGRARRRLEADVARATSRPPRRPSSCSTGSTPAV